LIDFQLQAAAPYKEILYEKWIKEETRVDIGTGSRAEDTRQKERAREENCKDSEAHRGRDTSKGIQPRSITRLARVTSRRSVSATLPTSPATYVRGAFI